MRRNKKRIPYAMQLGLRIFPIVLLLIISYMWLVSNSIIKTAKGNLATRLDYCAAQMNGWTEKIVSEMDIYRQVIEGYIADDDELMDFLHSTYERHDAYPMGICIGDETGKYLDSSDWMPGSDFVVTERPWYVAGKDSEEFVFCEPYIDAHLGVVCTSVSAKLDYGGKSCVMSADVYVDYADALVRDIMDVGDLDGVLLVSSKGHMILADSATPAGATGLADSSESFYRQLDRILSKDKIGTFEIETEDDTCYIDVSYLEAGDWYLVGYVRESSFLTPLRRPFVSMLGIAVAAILILVILTRGVAIKYRDTLSNEININRMLKMRAQENLDMVNAIIGSGLWYMEFNEEGEMINVFWSEAFRSMLGFQDTNDFPNRLESWSDRLHPEDSESTMKAYWDCVEGKQEYDVKYRLKKRNGEYDWFHAHGRTARYENGNPRLFLGTFINITKDLRAKHALEEAYHAANRANAAKTEFLSSMSHDIRTPLNGIIGMTAIAAANIGDSDKIRHCLTEITVSSKHLLALVNEVLDMNKIESGKISFNIEEFNLADLVDDLWSLSKPLVTAKEQDFSINIHEVEHENVVGDAGRLQQCLMNFVSNAVKYTPEGGTIQFSITEKPLNDTEIGCYEFVFEDNGIGMSEEFMAKLFEPFERADDERAQRQQGTGLGMTITRNIIQMMNGDVKVESKLNEGTKFTATVFLELQTEGEDHRDDALIDLPVLVADDDQMACESTCYVLNELGMLGEWVLNGREAVEKVAKRHDEKDDYFAVIVDWKMPDMDGVATARAIRERVGEDIPIIIISAYDWSDIEAEAREAGVTGFIAKPIFKTRVAHLFRELTSGDNPDERKIEDGDVSKYREEDFHGKRVLLAEDNELNAEIASEILGMTNLIVDVAWNGRQAVEMLSEAEDDCYDMVFMDIQMPIMDGYEATRTIRSSERKAFREIPIIAMSANAFAEDVQKAKAAGMNDHVAKPLDFQRLLAVLNKWL